MNYPRMKVIYIAGPYRDRRGEYFVRMNIRKAEEAALLVWDSGGVAITPHKNTAGFGGALLEASDDIWLRGDLELILRSDAVWMIDGWETSDGAQDEKAFAEQHGIPVLMSEDEVLYFLDQHVEVRWPKGQS